MKENRDVAVVSLSICTLITSLSWMYMRIPQYYERVLSLNSDTAAWLLYSYIIAEVSFVIVAGVMTDKLGPKNTLLVGLALFLGGTGGVYLGDSLEFMVVYRIIQGAGAGFIFTVGLAMLPKLYPKSKRPNPHKILVLMFALGSIFGTATGYYFILNFHDWRPFFLIAFAVVLVFGILAYITLPDFKRHHVRDVPGLVLAITTIALIMTYSQAVNENFPIWSWESLAFVEVCILSLLLFIVVEKKRKDPLIPHGLTKHTIGLIAEMFIVGFCGLGMLQYLSMFLIVTYHFSIYDATLMIMCLIFGGAITSLTGLKIVYRTGIRPLTLIGPVIVMIAFISGYFLLDRGPFGVAVTLFVMGLGFGFIVTEMLVSLQATSPLKNAGANSSLLLATRFIGIILGMAAYGGILKTALKDFILQVEGQIPEDITYWLLNNMYKYLDDLIVIFQENIHYCCILAGVAVLLATIVAYFFITDEDKNAPEFNE